MTHDDQIRRRLDRRGLVLRRDDPSLDWALSRLTAEGELVRLLPGTYARAGAIDLRTRAQAACARYPDAVVTGAAAAALTYWRDLPVEDVEVARPTRTAAWPGYRFARREVPGELARSTRTTGGDVLRCTTPAATALELAGAAYGGDAIDEVLRRRAATLGQLRTALALMPGREGNVIRRRLLLESRAEPWSAAERRLHQLLRAARITGWVANRRVGVLVDGFVETYLPDVAFPAVRLALEVEGTAFHGTPEQQHYDRQRQNALTRAGWTVLRIDWRMLVEQPERVVALITATLARLGRR